MNLQCLTTTNGDSVRFLKMMIKSTPYAQDMWDLRPMIFTDDANGYVNSLVNTFGEEIRPELTFNYFYPTTEMKERLERIKTDNYNHGDVLNHLNEYSDFVYYGYINSLTKSETLKALYPDYIKSSESYLDTTITELIKSIRKEFLCMDISYRGKPVKPNDTTMSRIGFIVTSNVSEDKVFPYRFENGVFADLTVRELREIQDMVIKYIQKIMTAENKAVSYLTGLSVEEKHELVDFGVTKIKEHYDNIVKDVVW